MILRLYYVAYGRIAQHWFYHDVVSSLVQLNSLSEPVLKNEAF